MALPERGPNPYNASPAASDEDLIASFQRGDTAAFDRIVARFKDPLMNFIFRFTGNDDDAKDILQETFLRVYFHGDSYKPIAKFSTWIYTIAANLAKTHTRRKKSGRIFSISHDAVHHDDEGTRPDRDLPDTSYRTDRDAERASQDVLIQRALLELDEDQRTIVLLSDVQELSYEEICGITGLKIGTVKSRLNRARTRLKLLLAELRVEIE